MITNQPCVEHDYQLQIWGSPIAKSCQRCSHSEPLAGHELAWPADPLRHTAPIQALADLTTAMGSTFAIGQRWRWPAPGLRTGT